MNARPSAKVMRSLHGSMLNALSSRLPNGLHLRGQAPLIRLFMNGNKAEKVTILTHPEI